MEAQARIVREAEAVLARNRPGDVLFVGHGAVGTLLFCHTAGHPVDRVHDQPAGGGNCFAFTRDERQIVHGWRRMEEIGA
jgi:broad specificity phosphatase PhoE